jgi:hypothetical protein
MTEMKLVREMFGPDTAPMGDMKVFVTDAGPTDEGLRLIGREGRDDLRRWFDGSPHYADLIARIDRINAEESESR